jgi:choice-of-anchor A domain-containing protein
MNLQQFSKLPLVLLAFNFTIAYGSVLKCKIANINELTVFTTENITAKRSDFQGSIAAGGNIGLENFYIDQTNCLSIAANGSVNLFKAATKGAVEGQSAVTIDSARVNGLLRSNGNITIFQSAAEGAIGPAKIRVIESGEIKKEKRGITSSANFDKLTLQMKHLSQQFASKPSSLDFEVKNDKLILKADKKTNVVTIAAEGLALARITRIEIHGEENQQVVINIKGTDVRLVELDVELVGSIGPKDIIWNFLNAKNIYIKNTINGYYGIPGTLIAPMADVEFYEGLITGALYAKSINYTDSNKVLKSGQINDGRINELPLE